jgi:DNA-binding winged helix-turn-helix (wHTH) protein
MLWLSQPFYIAQALSISLFTLLATYALLTGIPRRMRVPFVLLALVEAADGVATFLLCDPSGAPPTGIPWLLRLRWAIGPLVPVIFLQLGLANLEDHRALRLGRRLLWTGCGLAALTAFLALSGNNLLAGAFNSGPLGAFTIGPVLGPLATPVTIVWFVIALLVITPLLAYAARSVPRSGARAQAYRLLWPWLVIGFSSVAAAIAEQPAPAWLPHLPLGLAIAQRLLTLLAGGMLAFGVLRYGSPAGRPLDHRMAPAVLAAVFLIFFGLQLFLAGAPPDTVWTLVCLAVLAGVILAVPQLGRIGESLFRQSEPLRGPFGRELRQAWCTLASQQFDVSDARDLLEGLRREIDAEFVLPLLAMPACEGQGLAFSSGDGRPRLALESPLQDWPLQGDALRLATVAESSFGGPINQVLPLSTPDALLGLLAVGEPRRGGVYSADDLIKIEWLANLLALASQMGVPIIEGSVARPSDAAQENEAAVLPVIKVISFGRLEIRLEGQEPRRLPLRARQVLAYLLAEYPNPVPAPTLMERLWPEAAPAAAANSLYVAVHALRRGLEPRLIHGSDSSYILHQGDSYRLEPQAGLVIDVLIFESLQAEAELALQQEDPQAALECYQRALELYHGRFLDDPSLDLAAEVEVKRLQIHRQCQRMARFVIGRWVQGGQPIRAEQLLLRLQAVTPWDETFVDLMTSLGPGGGRRRMLRRLEDAEGGMALNLQPWEIPPGRPPTMESDAPRAAS